MATFIRTHAHSASIASGSGSSIGANTVAAIPAGNTLIAIVTADSNLTVSSLTKPGGETASWVRVSTLPGATGAVAAAVWAIKTTVTWSSAFTLTATLSTTCTGRTLTITEWAGLSTTVKGAATDRHSSASSATAALGEVLVPGDVAVYIGVVNTGGSFANRITTTGDHDGTATGTLVPGLGGQRPDYNVETNTALLAVTGAGTFTRTAQSLRLSGDTYVPTNRAIIGAVVGLQSDDYPPDTPTLTSMASGGVINRGAANRASHTFSSSNYVDSQSKFDLRYRLVGDPTWTTILAAGTTALYYDFVAGDLAAGSYERQVKVYGALGKASEWSTSGFFTAADAPVGPTLTYPTSGQTVDQLETATWSTPDGQDSYQLRRVADDSGDPDPGTIYFDTGEVVDTTTRALGLNFSVNGRAEHIQLRVKVASLWSEWDDVPVDVSYTPPPTPTMTLYPNDGSLLVVLVNPDPEEGDPAAVSNNIWINDGKGKGPERRATGVPTNGSWVYETPVSGRDYGATDAFWVEAVAANGTTARSGGV